MRNVLLETAGVVKTFGDFVANDSVSLAIAAGEIHALLGENGAGKSTLVKILYGVLQPDEGTLRWNDEVVAIPSPAAARTLGIGMVFQHFSLFEALTVAENIALAMPGRFDLQALSRRIAAVSAEYGLPLNPSAMVADLSVGERQRIEIVRCLLQEPKLLIMDEPTSVLTPQEAEQLFRVLERLAGEGCAVLYISHRLEEVRRLCTAATILRRGQVVAEVDPRNETPASLARLMVGAHVHAVKATGREGRGEPLLVVDGLDQQPAGPFSMPLRDISLELRAGEVLAVAGIAGNGQSELFEALSGERPQARAEAVILCGRPAGKFDINARRRLEAAFVSDERLGHAAVPGFTLSENVLLTRHASDAGLVYWGFVDAGRTRSIAARVREELDVRTAKADPEARALSGGNLQKFVIGRELDRDPRVLVVNQPTWGVDAGAAALIRQRIVDLARAGSAVLVISQDLDEIFEIADRIAVLSRGHLSEAEPALRTTREAVGLLMAGAHEPPAHGGKTEKGPAHARA